MSVEVFYPSRLRVNYRTLVDKFLRLRFHALFQRFAFCNPLLLGVLPHVLGDLYLAWRSFSNSARNGNQY
jgi:hypothetical protein